MFRVINDTIKHLQQLKLRLEDLHRVRLAEALQAGFDAGTAYDNKLAHRMTHNERRDQFVSQYLRDQPNLLDEEGESTPTSDSPDEERDLRGNEDETIETPIAGTV